MPSYSTEKKLARETVELPNQVRAAGNRARNPKLDGLRGVSILLVLLGHTFGQLGIAHFFLFPAFDAVLGVRIFFVISGYLITSIVLRERAEEQGIRLFAFFGKRLTKLFPALVIYVATLMVVESRFGGDCRPSMYAVALTFTSAIVGNSCWRLGHLWSLSVEEIFYVTWAPLVALFPPKRVYLIPALVVVAGTVARFCNFFHDKGVALLGFLPPRLYFISGLEYVAVGVLGACWLKNQAGGSRVVSWLSRPELQWASLAAVYLLSLNFAAVHWVPLSRFCTMLGPLTQAVATRFLVLSFVGPREIKQSSVVERIFSWLPLVLLGEASYSIYLWQQILVRVPLLPTPFLYWDESLRIALSLLVGMTFFYGIERPLMVASRRWLGLSS